MQAADEHHDGTFWRSISKEHKSLYLAGMLDGMVGGDFFVPSDIPESFVQYHAKLHEVFGNSTVGTLRDGLDKFYEDFRNRNIKVYRAITIVAAQINGMSDEKTQSLMERLRQWKDQ